MCRRDKRTAVLRGEGENMHGETLPDLEQWENSGEAMTSDLARAIGQHLDEIIESELRQIDTLVTTMRKPETGFDRLVRLIAAINAAIKENTGIVPRLGELIRKIGGVLRKLVNKVGGSGCTVGLSGWPPTLYIEISF